MYTCIGLMGAAAVVGSIDFATASRSGKLKNLYKDEVPAVNMVNKEINVDDYSRGAIDYEENRMVAADTSEPVVAAKRPVSPGKAKIKKSSPAPVAEIVQTEVVPAVEVSTVSVKQVEEVPVALQPVVTEAVPVVEEKKVEAVAAPPEIRKEETIFERFSRAPLKPRKITKKKS